MIESNKLINFKFISKVEELNNQELVDINGGGFFENLGYNVGKIFGHAQKNSENYDWSNAPNIKGSLSLPNK